MRAALILPGRGSYGERSLGSLDPTDDLVRRAEELRRPYDLPSLFELDSAARFAPSQHLAPANASPLTYLASMLDFERAQRVYRIVCCAGNSLGWYTALAAAGALSFEDGFRLVQEMSLLQQELASEGGQLLYPLTGEDWRPDMMLAASVEAALAAAGPEVYRSIELGGTLVLAGSEAGLARLTQALPEVQRGTRRYPLRLAQHGPYHTPLVGHVAARAREALGDLDFRAPRTTLIDGRGRRFTPWSTDVAELFDYTLHTQVVTTFDFARSVRVALREHAPERLVLPGPGNTLGAVCGRILAAEGWRGIRSHDDFDRVQESDTPVVVSMQR
jgi:malonyl CoA-acyl carrier protein transacylase